jgi:protein-S-isoprenylcysteine O-methyltransferase Ste14
MTTWIEAKFCALGRLVFRFRDVLVPLAVVVILLTTRREDFMFDRSLDLAMDAAGFLLLGLGLMIRVLIAASVNIRRSGMRRRIAASRLLRNGLYAHTRNPLYVANVLLIIGLALVYDSRWVWVIAVPGLLLGVRSLVSAEEVFLAPRFGTDYDDYRSTVPRFWPRLRGLHTSLADIHLDWRRAVRREHGTVFAATSAALVLIAAERIVRDGIAVAASSVRTVASVWVCCALIYGVVRWLKKTRRLETTPVLPDMRPEIASTLHPIDSKSAARFFLIAGIVSLVVLGQISSPITHANTRTGPGSDSDVLRTEQADVRYTERDAARREMPRHRPAGGPSDARTSPSLRSQQSLTSARALASLLLLGSPASRRQAR